jgi:hypothetical protein
MKKIMCILMIASVYTFSIVAHTDDNKEDEWESQSNVWREIERETERDDDCCVCTFTRSHQKEIEHLNAAITVYNALLAIIPYLLKDTIKKELDDTTNERF